MRQQRFCLEHGKHGGRRKGAGRKRLRSRGVAHRPREIVDYVCAQHVNMKYRTSIRNKSCLKILKRAYVDEYSSLGVIKELGKLAREARMMVITGKSAMLHILDHPVSWIMRY